MKIVVIDDIEKIVIKDVEIPSIKENEVLIKVKMAGVCGSDIHTFRGQHPFRKPPVTIGHEASGVIEKVGTNVEEFEIGDNVTVIPQKGCLKCDYCLNGSENKCIARKAPGVGNWMGMMGEYIIVPYECVYKLPSNIGHDVGALIEPLAVGFHAAEKAKVTKGNSVAILGSGPIGLTTLIAVLDRKVSQTLITDVMDYPLKVAEELGTTNTLNITKNLDWIDEAKRLNEGLFDVVLITAGAKDIVNDALNLIKRGGKVITVAMFQEQQMLDIVDLQSKEKEVIGCMTYTNEDFINAIDYLRKSKTPIEKIISHILPFEKAEHAFNIVNKKEDESLKVLVEF